MKTIKEYKELTKVSDADLANCWTDERGVKYSADRKRLLEVSEGLDGEYAVQSGTEVICNGAFNFNKRLTKVILPEGLRAIGNEAFCYCKLEEMDIPDSVTSIGAKAFYGCKSLGKVTMPNSVTRIGECAFYECISLKEITIPDNVALIEDEAFRGCSNLAEVTIGTSLTKIGMTALESCTSLVKFTVAEDNKYFCTKDGVLYSKDMTELIRYPAASPLISFDIPDCVTRIGDSAFSDATNLMEVKIPNSVTKIESLAFSECTGLTEITIPGSVRILDGFPLICTSLKRIVSLNPEPPKSESFEFQRVDVNTCVLTVPKGAKKAYSVAKGWEEFKNIVEM